MPAIELREVGLPDSALADAKARSGATYVRAFVAKIDDEVATVLVSDIHNREVPLEHLSVQIHGPGRSISVPTIEKLSALAMAYAQCAGLGFTRWTTKYGRLPGHLYREL